MLTTAASVLLVPGLNNSASLPSPWLASLIQAADKAIKTYLKRDIELTAYTEFYSGDTQRDIICRQYPVLLGQTTIASGSTGLSLPQTTISVVSTVGFHPGQGGDSSIPAPSVAVQTGLSSWTTVAYTGVTATSFTGCTGGVGTLTTGNRVCSPVVYYDQAGYSGQNPGGFADTTQLVMGTNWQLKLDSGGKVSNRGLLRRVGGSVGFGFLGSYPDAIGGGKLGGSRPPSWPRGEGNIKVLYSAGFNPVPYDLSSACSMLVAYMARNLPQGSALSSESLGGYSYSVLQASAEIPELGSLARTLAPYREVSW